MTQASSQSKPDTKTIPPAPATTAAKPGAAPATTPATVPAPAPAPAPADAAPAAPAVKKGSSRIFIASGPVYEFETTAKAEKFLNGGGETPAPAEYTVLRGKRIGTSKKVSLR